MTGPGGTNVSQACAACKHQRRKCAPDCALAPYFPPHRQTEFLNVHRLFGVRNIVNTVKNVDPNHREIAVGSMIQEANLRVSDPVGGSCGIVKNLHDMCNQMKAELDLVLQQVAVFRAAQTEGENGEVQSNVRSFYDDIVARNNGNVPSHCHPVHKASKKASTSGKDGGVEALQIGPYKTSGARKMSNIEKNDESSGEMKENDLDKPVPEKM
ncbi:LOB domain-containing protein [Heracleum sosnowskyi]|uniref:LOB domain-containing protein n=1 Tax=Heracleum sosnowskyi TaxID=360622 RepID=A0AAD8MGN5_9APIA|nr:LOB domain-containing protein [Heracleum sosnowskyi]